MAKRTLNELAEPDDSGNGGRGIHRVLTKHGYSREHAMDDDPEFGVATGWKDYHHKVDFNHHVEVHRNKSWTHHGPESSPVQGEGHESLDTHLTKAHGIKEGREMTNRDKLIEIVEGIAEGRASDIKQPLTSMISERATQALDFRKAAVAKNLFGQLTEK